MFTAPDDLTDAEIRAALRAGWGFGAESLEYRPVGFGSHHWTATDARGGRVFATVDDLAAKLHTAADTTDAAFDRLDRAFSTASFLHDDAGLGFVVAPVRTGDGRVLRRLTDRYSLVVHPFVPGSHAGDDGEFPTAGERRAMLDLLVEIHGVRSTVPCVDDFVVPHLDGLRVLMGETGRRWDAGPYAERALRLLAAHAGELEVLLAAYGELVGRVAARPERMVVTHGEPHAGNVIVTPAGFAIVDWDTALLAPPERDLWDLASGDASLLDAYSAATGVEIDVDALSQYALWYDLCEIGGYISLFRAPHRETADTAESWKNLQHFLRPAARWPALYEG